MKDGFIKTACIVPDLRVGDCRYNADRIIDNIIKAADRGVTICAFPELSISGYTCGDLFFQNALIRSAMDQLWRIAHETKELDIIACVGVPIMDKSKLYSCGAVIYHGSVLGIVPKRNIPNYSEFYEARHFTPGMDRGSLCLPGRQPIPMGTHQLFTCENMPGFTFGLEICEDLWTAETPSVRHAQNGALLMINLSASNEVIGKADYRRTIVKAKSGSLLCAYMYANAGMGESTTDAVYSGHSMIAQNGAILAESQRFSDEEQMIVCDIDLQRLEAERLRSNTFVTRNDDYWRVGFNMPMKEIRLTGKIPPNPFVPDYDGEVSERCREISLMQSSGLVKRLRHTGCKTAVIGLSGGLDSTLALIVTVNAFKRLGLDTKGIIAVTMPCFGTTDRTYNNACTLAKKYGTTLLEINIRDSVSRHFEDIGHDSSVHDVTYENSQARERTQILMDIANKENGLVIGTGDLSELALGWATYNGDHMSMYGVNASIPKTLVRYLVRYEAQIRSGDLKSALEDVLDTPVSPELLPPDESGRIAQKTEDLVGPYELHDFFLYYMMRFGFSPSKIFRMALTAFEGTYDRETILKWERKFYWRFFSQQFKRSCLPDGPKVGSVTLSPRSDLRMPSDASVSVWIEELENIE